MAQNGGHDGWLSSRYAKFSDLTIHCGNRTWRVHRVVVCAHSSVFEARCSGDIERALTQVISLRDDDPEAVHEMLCHMYTESFGNQACEAPADQGLAISLRVYALATKYNILSLVRRAAQQFTTQAADKWQSVEFAHAIKAIYSQGRPFQAAMSKTVVQIAAKHARELFTQKDSEFCKVAETVPKFAAELSAQIVKGGGDQGRARERPPLMGSLRCPGRHCRRTVDMETTVWISSNKAICYHCGVGYFKSQWAIGGT
ncbi:hypothetical protein PRZ48_005794 [Zasmidium cellare]|uniref:BTB domain-containing protein n=1 Tax=Zasmidium cellare TaxID=395010 RepID=A0ABR0ELA4_ZASCE|nr:hypothetical protein PRZ48_005794 [Zasmidium cellare]